MQDEPERTSSRALREDVLGLLSALCHDGILDSTDVGVPPETVFAAGDEMSRQRYGKRMCGFTCEDNCRCVVDAINPAGHGECILIGGFAVRTADSLPTAHFWIQLGDRHFDPTWTRMGGDVGGHRLGHLYFALPEDLPPRRALDFLRLRAEELGITLQEAVPWD